MKVESIELFLLSRLIEKLNRELFNIKPLSSLDFLSATGFIDIKSLSIFCFLNCQNQKTT
jgi:hypothetical protein